jgi:hypothetical protein
MLGRVCGLPSLELRVEGQGGQPRLGRVADLADRLPGVGKQEPCPFLVVAENLRDPVGPAGVERRRQARFERLDRSARLEPGDTVCERHSPHGCPRSLVRRLDCGNGLNV